jgi:hypothetical protein
LNGAVGLALVVLRQPLSNIKGPHSNNWVVAGHIISGTTEHYVPDHPLTQQIAFSGESMLDNVSQERLTLMTASKRNTLKDFPQRLPDLSWIRRRGDYGSRCLSHKWSIPHEGVYSGVGWAATP